MLPNLKPSEIAYGKWPWLLSHFGVNESYLKNKHGPCPICNDGKDRFRFDDKNGRGTWICNQCGSGDGYSMLQKLNGWTFREAVENVERVVGKAFVSDVKKETDSAKQMAAVKRIWGESEQISVGDPAWLYLNRRTGIELIPASLRYHPALSYYDGEKFVGHFPALIAAVTDKDGLGIGVHRIYLTTDGHKAPVERVKKLLAGKPIDVCAVRLGPVSESIGVAEGIETAIAASMRFGITTWAAISAGFMEKWIPPNGVKRVSVFGDNDASFTGQAAAYQLAKRLRAKGMGVEVFIPEEAGTDWLDATRKLK